MNPNILQDIGRLERLAADLRLLEIGAINKAILPEVPVLDAWVFSRRAEVCLRGIPYGHPTLPDGEEIVTSQVFGFYEEDETNFVRTLSRWYRLGGRAKA